MRSTSRERQFAVLTGLALLCWLPAASFGADGLPAAPEYRGDIRRDANGRLTVASPPPPGVASPMATSAPPVTEPVQAAPRMRDATVRPPPPPIQTAKPAEPDISPVSGINKTWRVGPGQAMKSVAEAAAAAKDGDTVEIEAGDYLADVAVWKQNRLTIRGVGGHARLLANGKNAEGKAIWVIRGGRFLIENIEFRDAKVSDANGAGIRLDKGQVTVRNCRFFNNENGILTSHDKESELTIENSEFGHNGAGDGRSHNIYVGGIKQLTVYGSYFHHAKIGHLLKSRALNNIVFYNRLTDEAGGRASYELDFPNGGLAYVVGNLIEQSATTENSNIVTFGVEGFRASARSELYFAHNTIINNRPNGGNLFLIPQGNRKVLSANNLIAGNVTAPTGPGVLGKAKDYLKSLMSDGSSGEATDIMHYQMIPVAKEEFRNPGNYDFALLKPEKYMNKSVALGAPNGVSIVPKRQYQHVAQSIQIKGLPSLPGAIQ